MLGQRLMWVAWPPFGGSCAGDAVFAVVDPPIYWAGGGLDLSREGVYTVTLFVGFLCCPALTTLLSMSLRSTVARYPPTNAQRIAQAALHPGGGP